MTTAKQTAQERMDEATAAIIASRQREQDTGKNSVQQAVEAAEREGVGIGGDPATMGVHELPPQYRPQTSTLSLKEMLSWELTQEQLVKYAQQGLLGQEYMNWAPSALKEHVMMQARQVERRATRDAGRFANKTIVDVRWEAYWEGKAPHPKTGLMCVFLSHVAPITTVVGINGRLWDFRKGQLYPDIPSEVLKELVRAAAVLDKLELYQNFYMQMGQVGVIEKVAQQGGQTNAAGWATSYLGPVGGPMLGVEGHIPGTI